MDSILFATQNYMNNLNKNVPREFDYTKVSESVGWNNWQQFFRQRLAEISGFESIRELNQELPLSPRLVEVKEFPGYRREKLYITTEPGIEIAFYLLLPNSAGTGPFPLVLAPHGHSLPTGPRGKELYVGNFPTEEEYQVSKAKDQDVALQAVAEGYAVIAMDVRGFGEMMRQEDLDAGKSCSCDELQKRAFMYGRSLIGERVHDMGKLIDYASTRPEIDTSRIAITGNSGGGTVSFFTAALDERISVCVPSSYFNTFAGSLMSVPHCHCNFIPGLMKLGEMYDIVGLIAPRPVLFVHGVLDHGYPIEHTREAYRHAKKIYEAMAPGQPALCELYEGRSGHRYYKERVWPFIAEHFGRR